MSRARDTRKIVRVPVYIRPDEEPDFNEDTLVEYEMSHQVSTCSFCGNNGHRFIDCPNRPQPYDDDNGDTHYA